jgi:hypothetical protein
LKQLVETNTNPSTLKTENFKTIITDEILLQGQENIFKLMLGFQQFPQQVKKMCVPKSSGHVV